MYDKIREVQFSILSERNLRKLITCCSDSRNESLEASYKKIMIRIKEFYIVMYLYFHKESEASKYLKDKHPISVVRKKELMPSGESRAAILREKVAAIGNNQEKIYEFAYFDVPTMYNNFLYEDENDCFFNDVKSITNGNFNVQNCLFEPVILCPMFLTFLSSVLRPTIGPYMSNFDLPINSAKILGEFEQKFEQHSDLIPDIVLKIIREPVFTQFISDSIEKQSGIFKLICSEYYQGEEQNPYIKEILITIKNSLYSKLLNIESHNFKLYFNKLLRESDLHVSCSLDIDKPRKSFWGISSIFSNVSFQVSKFYPTSPLRPGETFTPNLSNNQIFLRMLLKRTPLIPKMKIIDFQDFKMKLQFLFVNSHPFSENEERNDLFGKFFAAFNRDGLSNIVTPENLKNLFVINEDIRKQQCALKNMVIVFDRFSELTKDVLTLSNNLLFMDKVFIRNPPAIKYDPIEKCNDFLNQFKEVLDRIDIQSPDYVFRLPCSMHFFYQKITFDQFRKNRPDLASEDMRYSSFLKMYQEKLIRCFNSKEKIYNSKTKPLFDHFSGELSKVFSSNTDPLSKYSSLYELLIVSLPRYMNRFDIEVAPDTTNDSTYILLIISNLPNFVSNLQYIMEFYCPLDKDQILFPKLAQIPDYLITTMSFIYQKHFLSKWHTPLRYNLSDSISVFFNYQPQEIFIRFLNKSKTAIIIEDFQIHKNSLGLYIPTSSEVKYPRVIQPGDFELVFHVCNIDFTQVEHPDQSEISYLIKSSIGDIQVHDRNPFISSLCSFCQESIIPKLPYQKSFSIENNVLPSNDILKNSRVYYVRNENGKQVYQINQICDKQRRIIIVKIHQQGSTTQILAESNDEVFLSQFSTSYQSIFSKSEY